MTKRRGKGTTADSTQSIWPHLLVGFAVGALGVGYLGAEPGSAGVAGLVGAVLGYLRHCWKYPQARCWWPTWFWLGWFGLRGCNGRQATSGKYYTFKPKCPLHPNSPTYRRVVARVMGRGKS
jgi:hypothetical protein